MIELKITRGDTKRYELTAKVRGTPFDLTGSKAYFTVKTAKTDTDDAAIIAKDSDGNGIEITDAADGKMLLIINDEDTDTQPLGIYYWDVQIRTADSEVQTPLRGTLEIEYDITRRIT